jgi:hypothetical protein
MINKVYDAELHLRVSKSMKNCAPNLHSYPVKTGGASLGEFAAGQG